MPQAVRQGPVIDPHRYRSAREACRRQSPDLFFASHFTSKDRRYGLYALDAVARQLEEIMGGPQVPVKRDAVAASPPEPAASAGSCCGGGCEGESIGKRREVCLAVIDHLYSGYETGKRELDAFLDVNAALPLPRTWWETMIEGMSAERTLPRYATWKRVSETLGRSAGMRAFFVARVLGGRRPEKEDHEALWAAPAAGAGAAPSPPIASTAASQLNAWGLAMRWCEAIERVAEDQKNGRLLIPLDDLIRHKLTEKDVAAFTERGGTDGDERWLALMRFELGRVRNLFRGGARAMNSFGDEGSKRTFAALGVFAVRRLERLVETGGDPFAMKMTMSTWQRIKAMPRAVRVVWEAAKASSRQGGAVREQ